MIVAEQGDRPRAVGGRDDVREHRGALRKYSVERGAVQRADRLDEHVDRAAARQADGEGEFVADAVGHDSRPTVAEDRHRLLVDRGFDAAVAYRAGDLLARSRDERRAERPRRRAGDADDGGDRDRFSRAEPLLELSGDLFHVLAASAAAGSLRKRRRQPSPQK